MNVFTSPFHTQTEKTKVHELKILPQYYSQVISGNKKWELRRNDRDFQVGDVLILKEWTDEQEYTGRSYKTTILYVFEGGDYGLKEGYCILSIA